MKESEIAKIRDSSDIVKIIGKEVELKKRGRNFFGLCPFHDEKTPSFSVNPKKQIFYCFGCGEGGNVITFVMDYCDTDFENALHTIVRAGQ